MAHSAPPPIAARVLYRVVVEHQKTHERRNVIVELGLNDKVKLHLGAHCWTCIAATAALFEAERMLGPSYIGCIDPLPQRVFQIVH